MRIGMIAYGFERAAPLSMVSYTVELARALRAAGTQLYFLTTAPGAGARIPEGFPVHPLVGCARLPGLMSVGNLSLAAAARALRLDIVHDPNGVAPFLLRPYYGGARAVTTVHDLVSYVFPETHTGLTNLLQRRWLPLGLQFADAVVTVSEHSKRDLARYLGIDQGKICVAPCGVSPHFSPDAEPGEATRLAERYGVRRPYVLYLGDVQARKNVSGLVSAFALLREALPEYELVVAGAATWKYEQIYSRVAELGLTDRVRFTGYVSAEDVPALYRQSALFVFPSLYEGFGRPPLEAMACGTPVVTSNVSSLPEVVGDAALLADPHDHQALARAMERALSDVGLAGDLRALGLERARHFTWERAGRELLQAYEHVLAGTPAASPGPHEAAKL